MAYPVWSAGQRITATLLNGSFITVLKTADQQVTNSTTLVNDSHFFVTLPSNSAWMFDVYIEQDGQFGGGGGWKSDWSIPAGATLWWGINGPGVNGTAPVEYVSNAKPAGTFQTTSTYGQGANNHSSVASKGYCTVAASGVFQLRWAQWVADAIPTTVYARSWMRFHRLS